MDDWWVCESCRSINRASAKACYRCKAAHGAPVALAAPVPPSAGPSPLTQIPIGLRFAPAAPAPEGSPSGSARLAPIVIGIVAVLALAIGGALVAVPLLGNHRALVAAASATPPSEQVASETDTPEATDEATPTPAHTKATPSASVARSTGAPSTAQPQATTKPPASHRKPATPKPIPQAPTPGPPTPTPAPTPTIDPNWTVTGTIGPFVPFPQDPTQRDTVTYTVTSAAPGAVCFLSMYAMPATKIGSQDGYIHIYKPGAANTWTQEYWVSPGQGSTVQLTIECSVNNGPKKYSESIHEVVA